MACRAVEQVCISRTDLGSASGQVTKGLHPQLQEATQYPRGAIVVTFCTPNLQHLPMDACK